MIRHFLCLLGLTALLFQPLHSRASGAPAEIPLPAALSPALNHLIDQVGPDAPPFAPERIADLLGFVSDAEEGPLYYEENPRREMTSAFYAYRIDSGLERLLRYGYNAGIPSHLTNPSSVRRGNWIEVEGRADPLPPLWEQLPRLEKPVIVQGVEREEITPNLATGTYFEYDLDRTLILFSHRGQPALIAISVQKGRSEIGKKGAVLDDGRWDYLYSGKDGLAKPGLGWVDSYMYDSVAVTVFLQEAGERPRLKAGTFKWLNAGWIGMNMVNRGHIYEGLARYARDMRKVMEHPRLPGSAQLENAATCLRSLSDAGLERIFRRYAEGLAATYAEHRLPGDLEKILKKGSLTERTTRAQMEAALALEAMECYLSPDCTAPSFLESCRP